MKQSEIKIGHVYYTRISNNQTTVRIEREIQRGFKVKRVAWVGVNLTSGREVVIKSAAKLKGEVIAK